MPRHPKHTTLDVNTLERLGLSEHEANLYTIMLSRQKCTVQELGTWAPFPRTMLYYVLRQLEERGLVTAKKGKWKTHYTAEDPEKLYDILQNRAQAFDQEKHNIKELVPKLKRIYHFAGTRMNVQLFDGVEEYEKALHDVLLSGTKTLQCYDTLTPKKPGLESRLHFERQRVMHKIQCNTLFFENKQTLSHLASIPYNDYTAYRGISQNNLLPFTADIILYSNKILYLHSGDPYEPSALLVEDTNLYEMQKNMFEMLWKGATERTLYYTKVKK